MESRSLRRNICFDVRVHNIAKFGCRFINIRSNRGLLILMASATVNTSLSAAAASKWRELQRKFIFKWNTGKDSDGLPISIHPFVRNSQDTQLLPAESEIKTDITFAYEISDMKEVSPSRKKKWSRETHFLKPDLWAPSFALNSSVVGMGKCTWMDLFDNFLCKVNGSREPIQNKRDTMNYYYYYCIRSGTYCIWKNAGRIQKSYGH